MPEQSSTPRKIIGFSMHPTLAVEVKEEAARRGISLRKLFEEMWELYKMNQKT
jgi:hypothetical protein